MKFYTQFVFLLSIGGGVNARQSRHRRHLDTIVDGDEQDASMSYDLSTTSMSYVLWAGRGGSKSSKVPTSAPTPMVSSHMLHKVSFAISKVSLQKVSNQMLRVYSTLYHCIQ